jgi:hypothetical protein
LLSGARVGQGGESSGAFNAGLIPGEPPPLLLPLSFSALPGTGGISFQSGEVLAIGVGQAAANMVQITDKGNGGLQASWNSGPVHSFKGVQAVTVYSARGRDTKVTITVPDSSAAVGAVRSRAHAPTHGGTAVQRGNTLNVKVTKPTANTVRILDKAAGTIEVAWNGGPVRTFTGVTTILVHARNAREDEITFYMPPHP